MKKIVANKRGLSKQNFNMTLSEIPSRLTCHGGPNKIKLDSWQRLTRKDTNNVPPTLA